MAHVFCQPVLVVIEVGGQLVVCNEDGISLCLCKVSFESNVIDSRVVVTKVSWKEKCQMMD